MKKFGKKRFMLQKKKPIKIWNANVNNKVISKLVKNKI